MDAFEVSYGAGSPPFGRELGTRLKCRIIFGWEAVREKLFCREAGLEDDCLELLKIGLMSNVSLERMDDDVELCLMDYKDDNLTLAWLKPVNGAVTDC